MNCIHVASKPEFPGSELGQKHEKVTTTRETHAPFALEQAHCSKSRVISHIVNPSEI